MSKKKTPELPPAPTFQAEPNVQPNINTLSGLGNRLTSFDLSGDLSPLQDTINLDPEVTRLAMQFAQNSLTPAFNRLRTDTTNQLANLGALESSTTSNAFAQMDSDLASQFQAITAQAGLDDRARALQNRLGLFGTGLNTLESATNLGLNQQGQMNNFALNNYQNQVASILGSQGSDRGGLFGGLTGGIGGALGGFALGGPVGLGLGALGGGLMGGFGPSGTGGQLLNAGAIGAAFARPGSTAGAGRKLLSKGSTIRTSSGPVSLLDDIFGRG